MFKQRKSKVSNSDQKSLRLWPGIVIVILQWFIRYALPIIVPAALAVAVFGGLILGLVVVLWWAFFSRAPRTDRWLGVLLIIAAMAATPLVLHESIANGMMGLMFVVYATPLVSLLFVIWAVISQRFPVPVKRITMVVAVLLACGYWALLRTGGITADLHIDFSWRWISSPEEQLVAKVDPQTELPHQIVDVDSTLQPEWPGFRGSARNGIVHDVVIDSSWSVTPPQEIWRRAVGPGWSSFSVHGNLFFTQEQRGDDEIVACYDLKTGEPLWMHSDETRFWESNGGAGPRGTPTLENGRVYALGATGILNVLDERDGSVIWSRDIGKDTETKVPMWGFSASPLVLDDKVIVAAAGSLVAYTLETGDLIWNLNAGGDCYSSPHYTKIDGVEQILFLNEAGIRSVTPDQGNILWQHAWEGHPIVQPTLIDDGEMLISVDDRNGVQCITVAQENGKWTVNEKWSSKRINPYFNDSVIHQDYAYGFHGNGLTCVDLKSGERLWKGGRYGRGQFILLDEQDLMIVLSEKGELALVRAVPEGFHELVKFPAIEGKTWNHPVVVKDKLLVRNGQEMVAYQLKLMTS